MFLSCKAVTHHFSNVTYICLGDVDFGGRLRKQTVTHDKKEKNINAHEWTVLGVHFYHDF